MALFPSPLAEPAPEDLDRAFDEEIRFYGEWEKGEIPMQSAIVRVRQLRRIHPWTTPGSPRRLTPPAESAAGAP